MCREGRGQFIPASLAVAVATNKVAARFILSFVSVSSPPIRVEVLSSLSCYFKDSVVV